MPISKIIAKQLKRVIKDQFLKQVSKKMKSGSKPQVVNSKRQRKLVSKKLVPSSTMSFDLPAGEVIKRFIFKVKGKYKHTYAAGTPVPNTQLAGVSHALMRNIRILTDGQVLHKQVDVKWMRDQSKIINGSDAPAYHDTNAEVVGVGTEGFASIGNTGEWTAFVESFELPMEAVISSASAASYLNLSNQKSAVLEIDTHAITNLVKASDAVTYSAVDYDIDVEVSMTTAPHFAAQPFNTFRQTQKSVLFKGAQNSTPVELNRGASICGFWLELTKGQDREPLTIDEMDRCQFQITRNGTEVLRTFSALELMNENLAGSPLQKKISGTGYVSFLNNRSLETALKTITGSGVEALDLHVTLPSDLDYANSIKLDIKQDEIIKLI